MATKTVTTGTREIEGRDSVGLYLDEIARVFSRLRGVYVLKDKEAWKHILLPKTRIKYELDEERADFIHQSAYPKNKLYHVFGAGAAECLPCLTGTSEAGSAWGSICAPGRVRFTRSVPSLSVIVKQVGSSLGGPPP